VCFVQALAEGLHKNMISFWSPRSEKDFVVANANSLFVEHIFWEPKNVSAATSKALARKLAQSGVKLAHFHSGTFGWGNRFPGASPIPYVRRLGIAFTRRLIWSAAGWMDSLGRKTAVVQIAFVAGGNHWKTSCTGQLQI